ncbi:MAG: hypothetical protein MK116_09220 [Phycisphaerales bacterium]|nr:hypothetical protein [Phycisphaerales bacterium]
MNRSKMTARVVAIGMAVAWPVLVSADFRESAGWNDLIDRIGAENVPDGENVVVAQVEAQSGTSYAPDVNDAEMLAHTFVDEGPGFTGQSGHAMNVAKRFYGATVSMTPLVDPVHLYEAGGWCLDDFLRANYSSGTAPLSMPGGVKVLNHSWIGSFGNVNNDQIVLRRMDYVVHRDDAIIAVGVNNGGTSDNQALLCFGFNNISVGVRSGDHAHSDTPANYEAAGRMKPEICSDATATSWATPVVSSAAAMLVDQVRSDPDLNLDGQLPAVVKAVLLAAADHQDSDADDGTWSNEPSESGPDRGTTSRPLDMVQGAGQVDVNRSHLIMSGGRITGGVSPATTPEAPPTGWDWAFCLLGNSRTWNFTLEGSVDEVSIVAAWNRTVPIGFGSNWTMGDFDLELVALDADDQPVSLVGSGPEVFGAGNVLSTSAVDNVEHLYIRDLAPGRYQLRLSMVGGGVSSDRAGIAWYFSEQEIVDVPGDIDGNGVVNVDDLLQLLSEYGSCFGGCASDLNEDGTTGVDDLLLLLKYM